ncbi:MAG: hypothetical protein IT306_19060 [Chloroflexi bacterium]|nr:hypothetical protein [Chloroflexota bacterium]
MSEAHAPHRLVVERIAYRLAADRPAPVGVERCGTDAEGRTLYAEHGRAASRKFVYLPAAEPPLVAYVRDDPPPGYGLATLLANAFPQLLPRPEALGLLALLTAHHVILSDGTRLGGSRDALAEAVMSVALEPSGFVAQARRVPEWALTEALRPREDALRTRLLAAPHVRGLATPDFGFVRSIAPTELVIARVGQQPVDLGALLAIGTPSGHGESVIVRVVQLSERDARVVQADAGRDEGVNHGDPVAFVPTL